MRFWYSERKRLVYWIIGIFFGSYIVPTLAAWAWLLIAGHKAFAEPLLTVMAFVAAHPINNLGLPFWCEQEACFIGFKLRGGEVLFQYLISA